MRIIASISLMVIVCLVSFQEATFYAFFKINQEYFAENLCVEKEIKTSKCKGHCQLAKMMEISKENPSPEMPLATFEPTEIELFLLTKDIEITSDESQHQACFVLSVFRNRDFSHTIFHPPIA